MTMPKPKRHKRYKTYGGLLKWNHKAMTVAVTRRLNPGQFHSRFITTLTASFPDYKVKEIWKNA